MLYNHHVIICLQLHLYDINITEENTVEGTEFLMEIMEINEALSEVKSTKDLDEIRKTNNGMILKFPLSLSFLLFYSSKEGSYCSLSVCLCCAFLWKGLTYFVKRIKDIL